MIDSRDRFTFEEYREPRLEDSLPPRFLMGEAKHQRPFRPYDTRYREPVLLSLSYAELAGLVAFAATIGFCLGAFLFAR